MDPPDLFVFQMFSSSHLPTEVTKQRYRLPNHSSKNFTGTLLTQDLLCIDTMDAGEGKGVGIFECHGQGRNQVNILV